MSASVQAYSNEAFVSKLRKLLDQRRVRAARPLFNVVRLLHPSGEGVTELESKLLMLEGNATAACSVLDAALTKQPDSTALYLARARARGQSGDVAGAARDAAEAVVLSPKDLHANGLLGIFLHQLHRHKEAVRCLQQAVTLDGNERGYRRYLALAHAACGDEEAAAATLKEGVARSPHDPALRIAAILSCMRRNQYLAAEEMALDALKSGVTDAVVLGLLGHARSSLGNHMAAAAAYAEARKLAPEDPYVRHLAAAGGLATDAGRASRDYIRVVFDGYAARFDNHLVALGYRVPGLIKRELDRLRSTNGAQGPVLDLGCGTGLLAVAAAHQSMEAWVGVDLSPRMLAEAKKRDIYSELHEADIEEFLHRDQRSFPVVVSGDTLPYFGDLEAIFRGVASRLTSGGFFLFSLELLDEVNGQQVEWRLGRLSRYAHSEAYVSACCERVELTMLSMQREVVRLEGGVSVDGLLVLATKPEPRKNAR